MGAVQPVRAAPSDQAEAREPAARPARAPREGRAREASAGWAAHMLAVPGAVAVPEAATGEAALAGEAAPAGQVARAVRPRPPPAPATSTRPAIRHASQRTARSERSTEPMPGRFIRSGARRTKARRTSPS